MNTHTSLLPRFRSAITSAAEVNPQAPELLIERSGDLACHYAPFDHVNTAAKVVLLGLTPGAQQAQSAIKALRSALIEGLSDATALQRAKESASFSGPMRANLVAMLDHSGLHRRLKLATCADLFTSRTDLVHFTSALRYPVFVAGENYSGSPSILGTTFLRSMCEQWLAEELGVLQDAWWIPLGSQAEAVLTNLANSGLIGRGQVLSGVPHPSGANAERIAYFLGNKVREALSSKTNPDQIDAAKRVLQSKLERVAIDDALARQSVVPPQTQMNSERDAIAPEIQPAAKLDRFATTFVLRDYQGRSIYPVRSRKGTFTLAPRGANMHLAVHAIHVQDEEKAYSMVASGTYKIRAIRAGDRAPSLLGTGDRSVKKVERLGS